MLFTLEVIQAKHGDCLLLHYGNEKSPKLIVIDGGPPGIYSNFLKPRLLKIKKTTSSDKALPISMVMVSHLDDDHVNGVLALTDELIQTKTDREKQVFAVNNLWFNTFDDIVGNIQIPKIADITPSSMPANLTTTLRLPKFDQRLTAVIASTSQGRQLRDNANFLGIPVNNPFKPLKTNKVKLVRGDTQDSVIKKWDSTGLKITVIHPNAGRLEKLQKQWDKDLKKAKKDGDNTIIFSSLGDTDTSPFNLSSIVCLVEYKKKKILLTGDARSDDIMDGLQSNKLLDKKGKLHVDILKVPHHGSERDATKAFYETVTADHYVISADGNYNNPDASVLEMLAEVTNGRNASLYLTNREGKKKLKNKLDAFLSKLKKNTNTLKVVFVKKNTRSIALNLLNELKF